MRRTLQILQSQGLLNRLPYLDADQERGGLTFAYGLSDKGVKQVGDLLPGYAAKTFDEHSQRTLDHELEISMFHIALKKMCQSRGLQLYWQQKGLKCGVNPDALFAITDPAKPEGHNTLYYFLEIERAKLGNFKDGEPQIIRKLAKYHEYYNTDECEKDWRAFRQFRVILVQRTEAKREFLLSKLAEEHKHRMFWLTTEPLYKENIPGKIFKTPRDFRDATYSIAEG